MHDFTDFHLAKFHEISTQHIDRCCDENFQTEFSKFYRKKLFFAKKIMFCGFGCRNSTMITDHYQNNSQWDV